MGKNNDKSLQEQIAHLSNELEELRLEKEESKKNVLHFMQEADSARHEINLLRQQIAEKDKAGCLSPPPEKQEEVVDDKISVLISKINCLDKEKLNALFDHVEMIQQGQSESPKIDKLTLELKEARELLELSEKKNKQLEYMIEQYKIKESKQQEDQRQQRKASDTLKDELEQYKQTKSKELLLLQDKCNDFQEESEIHKKEHDKTQEQFKTLQDKYSQLLKQHDAVKDQTRELEQAKIRENHLKIINRTLRDELRKPAPKLREESPLNIEYLRNVIIKFLEKRSARAQLIPVISMLLQCGQEDQTRLARIIVKAK